MLGRVKVRQIRPVVDDSPGAQLYRTFRPGTIAHHYQLMLEYERAAFEFMAKVAAKTADLKDFYRRQDPSRDEETITQLAVSNVVRKGLVDDQAWFDRLAMREAAVLNALINKARFDIEFDALAPEQARNVA